MKELKMRIFIIAIFVTAFAISSCGHKHDKNHNHDADKTEKSIDKSSKEYASAYICPMHCEGSGGDAAGKCPVCGMDYVKNPDYHDNPEHAEDVTSDTIAEHVEEHDHSHDGHSHD